VRVRNALGILATASLLSGSAFAAAPFFEDTPPTVIISDRTLAPGEENAVGQIGVQGALAPAGFADYDWATDPVSANSANLFRFTAAFSLLDYVMPGDGNLVSEVQWLFNEFEEGESSPSAGSARTLTINGLLGESTLVDGDSFTLSSPFVDAGDGILDFRNINLSPTTTTTLPYDITGLDVPQTRVISLYVHKDGQTPDPNFASFFVVTTDDAPGDSLSIPTTIFDPPDFDFETFGDWESFAVSGLLGVPQGGATDNGTYAGLTPIGTPGAVGGYTFTPGATPAPGGTGALSSAGTASQVGFAGWQGGSAFNVGGNALTSEAGKLYRMRASMHTSNAATRGEVRIRWGFAGYNAGLLAYGFANQSTEHLSADANNPTDLTGFLLPRASGAPLQMFFENLNTETNANNDFTISRVVVDSTDASNLGGGNVVFNAGGTFTPAAGEPSPAPSPSGFQFFTAGGTQGQFSVADLNANRPVNVTQGANQVVFNFPAVAGGTFFPNFATMGGDIVEGIFDATHGMAYRVDVWVSSPNASNPLPNLRILSQPLSPVLDGIINPGNETSSGFFSAYTISLRENSNDENFGPVTNAAAASANPQVYSLFFAPQGRSTGVRSDEAFNISVVLEELDDQVDGTVTVHRITVTEYDIPE
jgi:hypothetical protein